MQEFGKVGPNKDWVEKTLREVASSIQGAK
jgi:hypothetical protein